jgi:hypothetical protein
LTRCLGAGFDFGSHLRVLTSWQGQEQELPAHIVSSPIFFVADPQATTLGLLAANHKPGYAVKTIEGWRSVYLGAAPASAWCEIARYAGAQIINEDSDVLYADRSWLALHTDHSGPRQISLPFRAEGFFEMFGRNQVAGATEHFSFNAADKWKTYLFYIGPFSNLPAVLN